MSIKELTYLAYIKVVDESFNSKNLKAIEFLEKRVQCRTTIL